MAGFPARGAKDPVEELSGRKGAGGDTVPDDLVTVDRLIVGVLTPHASAGPEVELPTMTVGRAAVVVSRTGPHQPPRRRGRR